MKVAIYTLGCKVNQYETQALERELVLRGHDLTGFDQRADAYIVNTCTVTPKATGSPDRPSAGPEHATPAAWWRYAAATPRRIQRPPWRWGPISLRATTTTWD